ncbi:hypothetical protein R5W23_005366 [Gemmata sp. JC673]|uniref:Uncharacterized protein n=1 Tax=Gemmata algarum TaxID=2975278 RepID=A0ABU5F928_9BACT|nr:hypothetical protein [Gemmata algarum]MDY3563750.1 hypothetical protein [Gemmata algarum]
MAIRSISHFTWQVLRTAKRSRKPLGGRALRLVPNWHTKDGSFLTALVEVGLLTYVTGSADAPFDATYRLTERGEHAAEYGEYEYEPKRPPLEPPAATLPIKKSVAKKK